MSESPSKLIEILLGVLSDGLLEQEDDTYVFELLSKVININNKL